MRGLGNRRVPSTCTTLSVSRHPKFGAFRRLLTRFDPCSFPRCSPAELGRGLACHLSRSQSAGRPWLSVGLHRHRQSMI
jgi:hypothetical protein